MKENDSFLEVKNELLSDYSSRQTDQVARLIGFSVALFTLLEAIQGSRQQPLSSAFSAISSAMPNIFAGVSWFPELTKLSLLFVSIWGLIFLIVRAVVRFSIYGHYQSNIMTVRQEEIGRISRGGFLDKDDGVIIDKISKDEPLHLQIVKVGQGKMAYNIKTENTRLFLFVRLGWFFNTDIKSSGATKLRGWLFYFGGSFSITLVLMGFLW